MKWIPRLFHQKESDAARKDGGSERAAGKVGGRDAAIAADKPIQYPEDDALGRAKSARSFAVEMLSIDSTEGVVVGVLGPWGSGKTSFVNLACVYLRESGIAVLEFNPWMFSGAEQLVGAFFVELSSQLKVRAGLAEVGELLADYGEVFSGLGWLPFVGPWIEGGRAATKVLGKLLQRRKEGIGGRRASVQKALARLEKPIVVVLDDIDRLTSTEIRDVFKLVRLTANFPNVIYLLAFDRVRVEEALGEEGISGRDYLEKILQIGVDLPAVSADVLNSQIVKALGATLERVENPGRFDESVWPDVFMEIIRPLLRNMRDVRRYAAAVHGTLRDLDGQVAVVDVLAMEAIRVFLPDVFRRIDKGVGGLTVTSGSYGMGGDPPELKQQIDELIKAGGERGDIVRALIDRLFPAGQRHVGGSHYGSEWKSQWLRERRVAHEDILRLYLERVMSGRLQSFADAEQAWAVMTDQSAFESYLRSVEIERLQDVISSLEAYEDQFGPEHVVPASVVLLNLLPSLPERRIGMLELDARMVVVRVVYRLVRALKEPEAVLTAVSGMLPQVSSLSSRFELVTIVGHRKGAGHKLVSEDAARMLEEEWRAAVRSADADKLAGEKELLRILLEVKRGTGPNEAALVIPECPRVTCGLLQSARSESRSQSIGSRAVRRFPGLAWDALVELYGDESVLRQRIEALKASEPEGIGDLLDLADKYLGGWRPKEFGEE